MALEKKALLITPSYSALPENQHLPGSSKDAVAVKKILIEKFTFKDSNIEVRYMSFVFNPPRSNRNHPNLHAQFLCANAMIGKFL